MTKIQGVISDVISLSAFAAFVFTDNPRYGILCVLCLLFDIKRATEGSK